MNTRIFADDYRLVAGAADFEAGMSGLTSYPASGSFVNTAGVDLVHVIAHLGTLNAADSPVLELKCSDANNGTLDQLDSSLAHTCNVTSDDGKFITWTVETKKLPADHPYLAVALSGTLTNGSYVDVIFILGDRSLPVTQGASAGGYTWVG